MPRRINPDSRPRPDEYHLGEYVAREAARRSQSEGHLYRLIRKGSGGYAGLKFRVFNSRLIFVSGPVVKPTAARPTPYRNSNAC
jgi:hypothetical protein